MLSVVVLAGGTALTDGAWATEGGGGVYANGAEHFMTTLKVGRSAWGAIITSR
jgi:hypothetical protein